MARILLEPTMNPIENCVYPIHWGGFSSHGGNDLGLFGAERNDRSVEVRGGSRRRLPPELDGGDFSIL
jgi:hypothetical protein